MPSAFEIAQIACMIAQADNQKATAYNATVGYEDRDEGIDPYDCLARAAKLLEAAQAHAENIQ